MQAENIVILKSAFAIAAKTGVKTVFIYIDPLDDLIYPHPIPRKLSLVLVTKRRKPGVTDEAHHSLAGRAKAVVTIPKLSLSRTSLIKMAVMVAMSRQEIPTDEVMLCIAGHRDQDCLDCIQRIDPQRETELLTSRAGFRVSEAIEPAVFETILNLTVELAEKGREGKPIGTIFVVGDSERVMQLSKQMIINPFKGYDEADRNILSPGLKETIREFSGLDGAFVVAADGTVLTAGRYLGAAADGAHLPQGLGSRHMAAIGITALTKAVAFVISESSGDLRLFKDGKIVMEIEKSQPKK
ncbi:MAG: DNA integrity scanning protein DisA nucleotide-binding domain protein [Deltaproteobacteria bacterium]|nr:DNA integrity scanning protein DisA nucleotide-binding domain protein [Deltaproteobacteria bacterium]